MTGPQLIALTDAELGTLHGAGPLAVALYIALRHQMDYRTGEVGRSTPISLHGLARATETHIPRGKGFEIRQPSEKEVRTSLDRLLRAGLLRRMAGDRLAFKLVQALTAQARPFQTGRDEDTDLSTEPGTTNPAPVLGMQAEPGTRRKAPQEANRAHIDVHENQNLRRPNSEPVDNSDESDRPNGSAEGQDLDRLLRIGRQRGIEARPGESWQQFRHRIFTTRPTAEGSRA